ncbi:hypothetical protein ACFQ1S_09730 [Kibdelosporangium lantanae]|uniref:Hydrolase n=1 Tax=Kibdelosporangium lantanae TaxID=1497396 RepID=A0ABW3MA75_9PSEU
MIGLPDAIRGLLFDLDGVLTGTAELHRQAWKRTFDDFLAGLREPRTLPTPPLAAYGSADEDLR